MSGGAATRTRPERRGWEAISFQQHQDRIKTMKSTIDCGPPRPHPLGNRREMDKKRQDMMIEMDNNLMLKRLVKAVRVKSIDNEIHGSVEMHRKFNREIAQHKRRMHLQKITRENNDLLKRIQSVEPCYSRNEWDEDARRNEHHRKGMSMYPEHYKPAYVKSPERSPSPGGGAEGGRSGSYYYGGGGSDREESPPHRR